MMNSVQHSKKNSIYAAVTGTQFYRGTGDFRIGMTVLLRKDPDNRHDPEAIRVELLSIGKAGYIANSTHTVPRGCSSAGRIYDSIDRMAGGKVMFIWKDTVIIEVVELSESDLLAQLFEETPAKPDTTCPMDEVIEREDPQADGGLSGRIGLRWYNRTVEAFGEM
jgi:hypothetical protein